QKAEAQAREAQIEAALERVRSTSMAMHHSDDLAKVAQVFYEQLQTLGTNSFWRTHIVIVDEGRGTSELWWYTDNKGTPISSRYTIPNSGHPVIEESMEKNKIEDAYTITVSGDSLISYINWLTEYGFDAYSHGEAIPPQIAINSCSFANGAITVVGDDAFSTHEFELLGRFTKVFEQAYIRFLDLQKAEAQAREAIKQASLDRVRGEIASMRSKDDLTRITPLVWQELTTLNVPFIRCGVLIMDEKRKVIQSYLSAPDGHPLGVFDLPYESKEIARGALDNWRKSKIYKDHWNKGQFLKFMQKLVNLGQIENPESYQGATKPPESLDLHFVPFK
ncbi:MAG: hypothetical protein KAQ62_03765, partial [Cyclobacteriaceae bacterium]|nr:hypothetical protein [Cyclobacteriaceae bacterium]